MSMAAVYWKHDSSSSGALYHLVTTYSVMKLRSELQAAQVTQLASMQAKIAASFIPDSLRDALYSKMQV